MTDAKNIYDYINEYIQFVYEWDEDTNSEEGGKWCDKKLTKENEEKFEEDFKFSAGNNWETGFDFVEWLLANSDDMKNFYKVEPKVGCLHKLLTFQETCRIINRIITYYEDNYDDASVFTNDISCESVLRHLVYIELAEMNLDDLKELLCIDDDKCDCCGEDAGAGLIDGKFVCITCREDCCDDDEN